MKALRLIEEKNLQIVDVPEPPPPGPGEVRLRMRAVGLNHIDLFGYRGMAFAQRALPITVGAESVGEIEAVGAGVELKPGTKVVPYGGRTCGTCRRCKEGRDNLCENIAGIMGFHIDGMAQQWLNMPARLVVPVPDNISVTHAACAGITYSTVEHMLTDNAKLQPGESILIHAAGSGIGSTAILYAKDLGCEIFTTASTDAKLERAKALGAHHLINYKEQRFETIVRRKTNKRGVDVVFEHIGPDTWAGSIFALARGGRLVTCGSTSGVSAETNLYSVFQQQLHIFGYFGSPIRSIAGGLEKMARGILPVIDSEYELAEFEKGLARLATRDVFGKIVVHLP
jgi:NADPH:quinone reductase-like Zn-dependent oxidoreductase